MKKIVMASMLLAYASAYAQDVLITQNGDVMNVYDVEVGTNSVFYKSEDKASAPVQRIGKSDIIMIKRKDGTKYDLGNVAATQAQPTSATVSTAKANQISETSSKRNEEIINSANKFNPEFVNGNKEDKSQRFLCILGMTEDSQVVNDEIEISFHIGCVYEGGVSYKDKYNAAKSATEDRDFHNLGYLICNQGVKVSLKNKTSRTLFIDLGNSFFIRNGKSTPYYVPSSKSTSTSSSTGVSVNLGAVAGALGIGGALAGGIGVGEGSTSGTVNTTYSQRVVSVPPMSVKVLDVQPLFECGKIGDGIECIASGDYNVTAFYLPKKGNEFKNGMTRDFAADNSPINFGFYLSYSDNENCQELKNMSVGLFMRRVVGFGKSKGDNKFTSSLLPVSIPDYRKCLAFVTIYKKGNGIDELNLLE